MLNCIEGTNDSKDTQPFSLSLWGVVLIKSHNNKRELFSFSFLRLVHETNLCSCSSGGGQRACPKGTIPVLQNAGLKSCAGFATLSSLPQWTGFFWKLEAESKMRLAGESGNKWDSQRLCEHSTEARPFPHLHFHQKMPKKRFAQSFSFWKGEQTHFWWLKVSRYLSNRWTWHTLSDRFLNCAQRVFLSTWYRL